MKTEMRKDYVAPEAELIMLDLDGKTCQTVITSDPEGETPVGGWG